MFNGILLKKTGFLIEIWKYIRRTYNVYTYQKTKIIKIDKLI